MNIQQIGMKMFVKPLSVGILFGIVLIGCSETPRPVAEVPVPVAKAIPADGTEDLESDSKKTEPYETSVGGFRVMVPADWKEQPPKSQYVLGEFSIPGDGGAARLTVASANGTIQENVDRWRGQFQPGPDDPEPRESEVTLDGKKGTLVELAGTYADMMSGTPNRGWRMLGVAVPIGPTNVFFKLTGPAKTIGPRRDEFLKFVESARMEK
jgi:hypothetical protein